MKKTKTKIIGIWFTIAMVCGMAYAQLAVIPPPNLNNGGGGAQGTAGGTGAPGPTGSPGAAGTFAIGITPTATTLAQATQRAAMDTYLNYTYTLGTSGGNINLSSPTPGLTYKIKLLQGTTVAAMPTFSPAVHWANNTTPSLTTTASGWDVMVCYVASGTEFTCDLEPAFQ